jgi:hypothetical protein
MVDVVSRQTCTRDVVGRRDNGGGWLHYEASKFNSRPRPTLVQFVTERIAAATPHWSMWKLGAGRCRESMLKATDATRYMAARLQGQC